jgi:1-acyl-sn-glycerol-3-phosphate acyltransferase
MQSVERIEERKEPIVALQGTNATHLEEPPKRSALGRPRRSELLYHSIRLLGRLCFGACYRIRVEGRENIPAHGPGILLPKHQFWTDIPIVALAVGRPVSFIAKQELFVYPGIRHFLIAMGGIPIDRLHPVRSLDSFHYVEQLLKTEEFIVLFPEGTYYRGRMGRGKRGFIQRILRFQEKMGWAENRAIPFIPMGVQYQKARFRTVARVRIGPPLVAPGGTEGIEFTRRIMARISELSGLDPSPLEE